MPPWGEAQERRSQEDRRVALYHGVSISPTSPVPEEDFPKRQTLAGHHRAARSGERHSRDCQPVP